MVHGHVAVAVDWREWKALVSRPQQRRRLGVRQISTHRAAELLSRLGDVHVALMAAHHSRRQVRSRVPVQPLTAGVPQHLRPVKRRNDDSLARQRFESVVRQEHVVDIGIRVVDIRSGIACGLKVQLGPVAAGGGVVEVEERRMRGIVEIDPLAVERVHVVPEHVRQQGMPAAPQGAVLVLRIRADDELFEREVHLGVDVETVHVDLGRLGVALRARPFLGRERVEHHPQQRQHAHQHHHDQQRRSATARLRTVRGGTTGPAK